MARFGKQNISRLDINYQPSNPLETSRGRSISPNKQRSNSISPSKRKPFVSTTKSQHVFGDPPPLPPRSYSPERFENRQPLIHQPGFAVTINDSDIQLSPSHSLMLQRQSVRWLNLSSTFWALIVMDANRTVDKDGVVNFFEVMKWRAHGTITAEEFTALYIEWIGKFNVANNYQNSSKKVPRSNVGLFTIRQILLENRCSESDLDLYIGMLIHETNLNLLNVTISYVTKSSSQKQNSSILEICTKKWLSISEELFFCLDTPGYGVLRFDEIFFFSSCLAIGLQGWADEGEVQSDLSLGVLTSISLQLLRDAGANIHVTSFRQELQSFSLNKSLADSDDEEYGGNTKHLSPNKSTSMNSSNFPYGKYSVTVAMFKQYLIKKGIGEAALAALLIHVKSCIERLARITVAHAEDLYLSSKPLENQRNIGSPRLWQHAVLVALGYDSSEYEKTMKNNSNIVNSNHNNITQIPSIMLAMLSDSEKLIPGVLRACETQINDIANSPYSPGLGSAGTNRQRLNPIDELHETAVKIWGALRTWGVHGNRGGNNDNIGSITEIQRDPTYQIILTSLVEYKSLQLKLCGAFYDIAMTYYGLNGTANAISMVCASLIPNAETMIIELFGSDDDPNDFDNDDTIASSRNHNTSEEQIYDLEKEEEEEIEEIEEIEQKSAHTETSSYDEYEANSNYNEISPPPPPSKITVSPPQRRSSFVASKSSSPTITGFSRRQSLQATTSKPLSNIEWQSVYERKPITSPSTSIQMKSQSSPEEIKIDNSSNNKTINLSVLESQLLQELLESSDNQKQSILIEKLRIIRLKQRSNNNIDIIQNEMKNNTISSFFPRIDDNIENDLNIESSNNSSSISIDSPNKSNIINVNDTNIESPSESVASMISKGTNGSDVSTAPSSIIELLEQGQSAGKYAQTLREILRKMSKDNSSVQLKSLEEVLKLGKIIVEEGEERKKQNNLIHNMKIHQNEQNKNNNNQIFASKVSSNQLNNSSSFQYKNKEEKKTPFKSINSTPNSSNRNQNNNSSSIQDNNVNSNRNYNQLYNQNKSSNNRYDSRDVSGAIRIEAKSIPGSIPKTPSGKKIKAFGHPV